MRFDGKEAIDELVGPGMGVGDTQLHQLLRCANSGPGCQRKIQIPWDEHELVCPWNQVEIEVVAKSEITVEICQQGVGGNESQKCLDIQKLADVPGKVFVIAAVDQPGEFHEAFFLFVGGLAFRFVALFIALPGRTQIGQPALQAFRLEQHPFPVLEMPLEECLADLLDQSINTDKLLIIFAGYTQGQFGNGGARGWHAGIPEISVGQRLTRPRRITDATVEVEHGLPIELLTIDLLVQVNLQRLLQ